MGPKFRSTSIRHISGKARHTPRTKCSALELELATRLIEAGRA